MKLLDIKRQIHRDIHLLVHNKMSWHFYIRTDEVVQIMWAIKEEFK